MTDKNIRNIFATSLTYKNRDGETIHVTRDSFVSETLLSFVVTVMILSCMILIKSYVEPITISMYPTYSLLVLALLHTFVRRLKINKIYLIFFVNIAVSMLFYFVATDIPALEFGNSGGNTFYLIVVLVAMTLFSILYRLKPTFTAADYGVVIFAAIYHIIFFILFSISKQEEPARNLVINALIIAALYIVMRQIAVFDDKYYHSIHKLTRSSSLLKRQNYKTVAGLIGIFVISLGVLVIFPYKVMSKFLITVARGIFGFFRFMFQNGDGAVYDVEVEDPYSGMDLDAGTGAESIFIYILAKVMFFLIVIVAIAMILNVIRVLIKNAPKAERGGIVDDDDILVDTIEDISPEKKIHFTRPHDFGSGYERRIRKQFYDKTRRAMKKGLPVSASSSPGQIEKVLSANGDRDISSLRSEYEKVRYGK